MENFIGKKIDQNNSGRENSPGLKKAPKKIGVSDLEGIEKKPQNSPKGAQPKESPRYPEKIISKSKTEVYYDIMPKPIESTNANDANKNPTRKLQTTPPTAPSMAYNKIPEKSIPTTDADNMIPLDVDTAPKIPVQKPPPSSANLFRESPSSNDLIFDNKVKMDFYKPPPVDQNPMEPTLMNREETYSPYLINEDNQAKAYQNMMRNQKEREYSLMRGIDMAGQGPERQPASEINENYCEPVPINQNEILGHTDYNMHDTESEYVYKGRSQDNE